jgi:transcriptional regulator with XRE-family HTH domain
MTVKEKIVRIAGLMSCGKLAKKAGLSAPMVHAYINGKSAPRADNILPIADALGIDVRWLLDPKATWPPKYINTDMKRPNAA